MGISGGIAIEPVVGCVNAALGTAEYAADPISFRTKNFLTSNALLKYVVCVLQDSDR